MTIANISTQRMVAVKAGLADTFLARLKGLLGRTSLEPGEALVITRCNSIHMFFMRFALDVVFVDRSWCVVGLVRGIRPFQLSPIFWRAATAIELPVGTIASTGIIVGQTLFLDQSESGK
ncbi:MAG: DUF192 domain-containing protein [Candidatus Omnitrophica bacterium]|nr:DUF192 domain-containing protein [Candidatus Omnitrophota bacterium]